MSNEFQLLISAMNETGYFWVICLALALICIFEFINGFHDAANAIATSVYTNSIKPIYAVAISGALNFVGVLIGGISVAMGIIQVMSPEVIYSSDIVSSIILAFSILLGAILWNYGTWHYGIPASSSHTLIGAMLGGSVGFSFFNDIPLLAGVNWAKAMDIFVSFLISPIVGFFIGAGLLYIARHIIKNKEAILATTQHGSAPPLKFRIPLLLTSAGVSLAHGSNDGQKGVGLLMLVLISCMPAYFAMNPGLNVRDFKDLTHSAAQIEQVLTTEEYQFSEAGQKALLSTKKIQSIAAENSVRELSKDERISLRKNIGVVLKSIKGMDKEQVGLLEQRKLLSQHKKPLQNSIEYAPFWALIIVATSISLGTLIGWKRVAHTIGAKLGNSPMTYSSAITAQTTAALTIGIASITGLPVSTTHMLSSGVVGSSWAVGGGINQKTVRSILITWAVTLPMAMIFSTLIYGLLHWIFI